MYGEQSRMMMVRENQFLHGKILSGVLPRPPQGFIIGAHGFREERQTLHAGPNFLSFRLYALLSALHALPLEEVGLNRLD